MAYTPTYYPFYTPQYYNQQNNQQMQQMPDVNRQFYPQMPTAPQNMPQPSMQTPQATNDFLWVLGEVEATSYPVLANNSVTLWDKNAPTIYIKSVNAQGVPSMRILDFTERTQGGQNSPAEHKCHCGGKYASIEELKALRQDFEALRDKINALPKTNITEDENV